MIKKSRIGSDNVIPTCNLCLVYGRIGIDYIIPTTYLPRFFGSLVFGKVLKDDEYPILSYLCKLTYNQ